MTRQVLVTALDRSWEAWHFQDKMSYRVAVSQSEESVVFEARVTLATLEILADPQDKIREYYLTAPLPENGSAVDLKL